MRRLSKRRVSSSMRSRSHSSYVSGHFAAQLTPWSANVRQAVTSERSGSSAKCCFHWRAMVSSTRGVAPGAGDEELPAPSLRRDGAVRQRGATWRVVLYRSRRAGQGVASVRSRGARIVSSLWSTRARFRSSQVCALSPRACGGCQSHNYWASAGVPRVHRGAWPRPEHIWSTTWFRRPRAGSG